MAAARTLYFTGPLEVGLREHAIPIPAAGEVLVQSIASGISAGSELLVYRGQFPPEDPDPHDQISTGLKYPIAYGYACVGKVVTAGASVDPAWRGRLVFSFQPHTSHFTAAPDNLLVIPGSIEAETACFLPSMETAVNLVQDGAPLLGERVMVFGQGVVGLLVSALLAEFPLDALLTADRYPRRREASLRLGPHGSLDPGQVGFTTRALELLGGPADVSFELSGNPAALDQAIALTAFSGKIVLGSWYGEKRAPVGLGAKYHRSRVRIISSQVSTIAPELSGRWDKRRRFQTAFRALERLRPQTWISHRFSIQEATAAYHLLDQHPEETLQVIFQYD